MLVSSYSVPLGAPAPPFSLPGTDGKTWSLESFRDRKALVVVFTCNHCPYAQAWEGRLLDIQRDYGPRGVALVAINPNDERQYPQDSMAEMVKRAKQKNYNFPYLRDESQAVARAYGAQVTPHILLFDAERKLRYQGRVDDNHENPGKVKVRDLRNALDALLAGRAVPVAETPAQGCSVKWKN
ncbi:MAG: thioredoxin family protein [Halobacteria archaeon]